MSVHDAGGARRRRRKDLASPLLPGRGPLAHVPPVVTFLVVAAVFAAGVLIGGVVGAVLLGVLALGVIVLLATTWPRLTTNERVGRLIVIVVLLAVLVSLLARGGGVLG